MKSGEPTPDMNVLVAHPDTPPRAIERVTAQLSTYGDHGLWLEYSVFPAGELLVPAEQGPVRRDGLWKATCFEFFVKDPKSGGYLEFNFSPSFEWAAYEFSNYRSEMRDFVTHDPEICLGDPLGTHFFLAVEALPDLRHSALRIGLSAVLEEKDGTKSYWALAHPSGAPDFHHPDCFALELPAPEDA